MTHHVCSSFASRVFIAALTFAALPACVRADAINFLTIGSQQVPSIDVGRVKISGSDFVVVTPNAGLTIRGGLAGIGIGGPDNTIDPTESITFRFDAGSATNILLSRLFAGAFGNPSTTDQGESLITAFGPGGNSLGTVDWIPPSGPVPFNISASFGDQPISSFTLQPKGDSVSGSDITLSGLSFNPVPEPASLVGWGGGALVLMSRALKRRKRATIASTSSPDRD